MKINDKFFPLWNSNDRYYLITGGRGSGKSFAVNDFIENLTFQKGHTILFTRYTLSSASKSIIPEFLEKVELEGHMDFFHVTKNSVINKKTGSKIIFSGIKTSSGNQTASLKSLQGVTTWVLDEAEELTDENIFDTIDLSVRQKHIQNRVIIVMNPTFRHHWIWKRYFREQKPNTTYIHTTFKDNIENLNQSFLDTIDRIKVNDPEAYKHKILGGWIDNYTGLMYPNIKIIEDVPEGEPVMYCDSADTGRDYLCSIVGNRIDDKIYIKDVLYTRQPNEVTEIQVAKQIINHNVNRAIIESNNGGRAFARNVERIVRETYKYSGVTITAKANMSNKITRILSNSSKVQNNCYFCSTIDDTFMNDLRTFVRDGKNEHDDAPDAITGLIENFTNSNELIII